jgi:hypothetical protein
LGFGFGVLGFGVWAPTPNPQSPIPNPQSPIPIDFNLILINLISSFYLNIFSNEHNLIIFYY